MHDDCIPSTHFGLKYILTPKMTIYNSAKKNTAVTLQKIFSKEMFAKFPVQLIQNFHNRALFSTYKAMAEAAVAKPLQDFRLEAATPCDTENILSFVEEHFLKEEVLTRTLIPNQKPKVIRDIFRDKLSHGLSVIARSLCDGSIVGVSINDRSCKLDGVNLCRLSHEMKDCDLKKLLRVWAIIHVDSDLHRSLGQSELFNIGVVSVAEPHWGKNIGIEMVKKSLELGSEKKFQVARVIATNDNIRKIAEKFEMTKHWSAPYSELMNRDRHQPKALPEHPHCEASVFYKKLSPKWLWS